MPQVFNWCGKSVTLTPSTSEAIALDADKAVSLPESTYYDIYVGESIIGGFTSLRGHRSYIVFKETSPPIDAFYNQDDADFSDLYVINDGSYQRAHFQTFPEDSQIIPTFDASDSIYNYDEFYYFPAIGETVREKHQEKIDKGKLGWSISWWAVSAVILVILAIIVACLAAIPVAYFHYKK
jgi:hypothetical protein